MPQPAPGLIDRLLRPFSRVEPGEGPRALLMLACVFLILTAYYVMKTAREGLILAGGTFGLAGDELKLYATGAMALLLVGLVPAYSRLADRVRRLRLITISYALVMASLVAFFVLGRAGAAVGLPFFIWLGLVNVFLIAQFWSYANDIYTEEQGKRLFAIIAIGGSLGAIVGPRIASVADTFSLMLIAAAILVASVVLFNVIERLPGPRGHDRHAGEPTSGPGGFTLVLRDRYLLLIAALVVVVNVVNTTGEFVLSNAVREHAIALVPDGADTAAIDAQRREIIKGFFSDFFFWVNLVGFLVQAFLVSRIIGTLGVRGALFVLPVIAFGAYAAIGIVGGLALLRVAKIAENATDYSLQNTVRQALFLPTDRAVKYKAKATIDTFFFRLGDTLSAVLVGVGLHQLGVGPRQLVFANLVLVAGWLAIAAGIALHYRALSGERSDRGHLGRLSPAGGKA
jgi:ATP:ADP antiporter, AAA family